MPKPRKVRLNRATDLELRTSVQPDPGQLMEVVQPEPAPVQREDIFLPRPVPVPQPMFQQGYSLPGPVLPAPMGVMMPPASFINMYSPYMQPFTATGPIMADNGLVSYSVFSDATGKAYVQMTASVEDMQAVHRNLYLRQQHQQTHAAQTGGARAQGGG